MFRFRRYRVYVVFSIIAIGALYHFTTIDGLEGAGAASVERLKQFGPKFDSAAAAKPKDSASKDLATNTDGNTPIAVPSQVKSGDKGTESSKAAESDVSESKNQEKESSSKSISIMDAKTTVSGYKEAISTELEAARETGLATSKATATAVASSPKGGPKGVSKTTTNGTATANGPAEPILDFHGGEGRLEIIGATDKPKIHWTQLPDHFPVPTDMLIHLPTGKPKMIPKVQHDFKKESVVDEKKLDTIRQVFSFSWSGYRKRAWLQDELSPVSGKYRNPFNNWGATLIDSLDTLWMMDLKEEFQEAVEAVGEVDFTTSPRNDIPLFETVIRYLGGLVAAYDISGEKHKVLLEKAVELADILMGAFDTPNRMPMTYYLWKPTFASQPHRAKTRVVLAELGSLSLEFTRLAQITKEARYYDAIARITNELEMWQPDTKVPGLWPQMVDASGCKKPDMSSTSTLQSQSLQQEKPLMAADKEVAASNPSLLDGGPAKTANGIEKEDKTSKSPTTKDPSGNPSTKGEKTSTKDDVDASESPKASQHASSAGASLVKNSFESAGADSRRAVNKRDTASDGSVTPNTPSEPIPKKPDCEPQGLASPPHSDFEQFTMGGQADSTYEYLPKEYLLLGGLEEKYRTMYEMAANATRENLLYRPMIPDEKRNILHSGLLRSRGPHDKPEDRHNLQGEGTHLTCFIGGMFALGSKIFNIPDDMDLAKRLTDGCVWAYEQTSTGIMPEGYDTIVCKSMDSCPWNVTLWQEVLDPYAASREQNRIDREQKVKEQKDKKAQKIKEQQAAEEKAAPTDFNSDNSSIKTSVEKASKTTSVKETKTVSDKGTDSTSDIELKSISDEDIKTSSAKDPKPSSGKETKTGFEKESKSGSEKTSKSDTERESKSVSQSSLHKSSDDTTSDLPMGKATSDKASGMESLKKRQLGEVDNASSKDDSSQTREVKTTASSKLLEPTASSDLTKDEDKHETNPTGNAPDPLQAADKEALSDAAKSAPDTTTKDEGPSPVRPAPTPPAVSQADTIADEYEPLPILTREEFVADKIKNERLPLGIVKIWERKYILRPEAIESVFIMYRATGDEYWREKGWKMFEAIEKHTTATYGASAIRDVTAEKGSPMDEMESFWLAETLKYFYLLFSDPDHVSLDDWVLNTEAHPFKRPKP